jgi:hypothetical protein
VAYHHRRFLAEPLNESDDVTDQIEHIVGRDSLGAIGQVIPSLIGRDGMEARLRKRAEMMAPRVP